MQVSWESTFSHPSHTLPVCWRVAPTIFGKVSLPDLHDAMSNFALWAGFITLILMLLALDLGLLNRKAHVISVKEAMVWTAFWVSLSLCFSVFVYFAYKNHWFELSHAQALEGEATAEWLAFSEFLTGYIVEQSLSLDNIFVIALIFAYFKVPAIYQHRVLFWGILGAIVMRGAMIGIGAALITRFHWIMYLFGGMLILTAFKLLLTADDAHVDPEKNPLARIARRLYPVSPGYEGQKFFTTLNGRRAITPMFLVLLVVESTDVMFAVDSIPAIFAITQDTFIVFTSNVFAILGLRSMYFALAAIMGKFRYLKISLVFILGYVGLKMLLSTIYPIPTIVSLGLIAGILAVGITASVVASRRDDHGKNGDDLPASELP